MPVAPFFSACSMSLGQLDVRVQLDVDAVERVGALGAQPPQLLPRELELVLLQPVFGEHRAVRIDDDDVVAAVDDQHLAVADQLARVVRRDHGGNVEARARRSRCAT